MTRRFRAPGVRGAGAVLATLLVWGFAAAPLGAQGPVTAFVGVSVIPMDRERVLAGQTVVVVGTRIAAVGPTGRTTIPAGATRVDGRGKYLIPGLWDMHVHVWDYASTMFPLFLANGVTGIREAGTPVPLDTVLQWRRDVASGKRLGPPRQVVTGGFLQASMHLGPRCPICGGRSPVIEVATPARARHVIDSLRAAGADFVKAHGLSPESYFAVAAEARRAGISFEGHVDVPAVEASDSGARVLDHVSGKGIPSLCLSYHGGNPDSLGPSVAGCAPLAAHLWRNGTWFVPTLLIARSSGMPRSAAVAERYHARAVRELGRHWPDSVLDKSAFDFFDRLAALYRDSVLAPAAGAAPQRSGVLDVMHQAGVPMLAGTDTSPYFPWMVPGFALHAELAVMVAEGMPPFAALQAATLNPARYLGAIDSLGTIAPGKLADLVLLDDNPLVNIDNTTKIHGVVANGRYFDRDALDTLLAHPGTHE